MSLRNLLKTILPIIIITGFVALGVGQVQTDRELKLENTIELKSREAQLIELNNKYEDVLKQKTDTQKERDEQSKQIEELESERIRLEKELSAKKRREAAEAEKLAEAARRATATRTASASGASAPQGNCQDWMRQAGITETAAAYRLIMKESGCRPTAVNPSSGACGIAQALPCSKKPGQWDDPVNSMRWMQDYVMSRYGSWQAALNYWHCIGQCTSKIGTVNKTATWY